jgi:HEAT repeat protein
VRTIVATAILCLVLLLAALVLYIVVRRAGAALWDAYRRRRRALLSSSLNEWLASGVEQPPALIARPRSFVDRDILMDLCLGLLPVAKGSAAMRLRFWLRDSGMVSSWNRELSSRNQWKRSRAAERLATAHPPESIESLIAALDDPVFDVRMRAAKALGSVGGTRARRALIEALADSNRWSVIRIADLLVGMGPEVATDLTAAYPGMARDARLAALELVSRVGDGSVTPFLVSQLDDLDRDIRARAAAALGRAGDSRAILPLRQALDDAEWPVRAIAAKALGMRQALEATGDLAERLRDGKWWVRANAAGALCLLGERGIDTLFATLDDQDQFARDQALAALEANGELQRRLQGLASTDPGMQASARALLSTLAARQPRARMEALRDRQKDDQMRREIEAVLRSPSAPVEARK